MSVLTGSYNVWDYMRRPVEVFNLSCHRRKGWRMSGRTMVVVSVAVIVLLAGCAKKGEQGVNVSGSITLQVRDGTMDCSLPENRCKVLCIWRASDDSNAQHCDLYDVAQ